MTGTRHGPRNRVFVGQTETNHRRDLADQFDLEALGVLDRRQDDTLDQPTNGVQGLLRVGTRLKRLVQTRHLFAIHLSHIRMQTRLRRRGSLQTRGQCLAARFQFVQLALQTLRPKTVGDGVDEAFQFAFDLRQVAGRLVTT